MSAHVALWNAAHRASAVSLVVLSAGIASTSVVAAQSVDAREACSRTRDDDTIRPLPASLAAQAMQAQAGDGAPPAGDRPPTAQDLKSYLEQTYFRCMDGSVYVCSIGANLPCTGKPDRRRSIPAVGDYCRTAPNADAVPMAVTGHSTIYSWSCVKGRPVIIDRVQLDRRGFQANIWTPLPPPGR